MDFLPAIDIGDIVWAVRPIGSRRIRHILRPDRGRIDARQITIADVEQLKEIADFKRSFLHVGPDRRTSSPLSRLGR